MKEPSKKDLRDQIRRQVEAYVDKGGEVRSVERGTSGRNPEDAPLHNLRAYDNRPRESRTPVPEVVAAIERRRLEARKPKTSTRRKSKRGPKRRLIYDEFGEPLRYTWVDD